MADDHEANAAETETEKPRRASRRKAKASKSLPTPRVRVEKQLDVVRAYAAKSGMDRKPVTNAEIADIVGMAAATISLVNPFLCDIGLIRKADGGYVPTEDAFNYLRAVNFKSANPEHKLAPTLRQTWFYESLAPKLQMGRVSVTAAIMTVAEAADAHEHHKPALNMILEYLVLSGLVMQEDDELVMAHPPVAAPKSEPKADPEQAPPGKPSPPSPRNPHPYAAPAATAPEGVMQFHATINVSMAELATWSPDRIAAFMSGLAKVIAAQGGRDEAGS